MTRRRTALLWGDVAFAEATFVLPEGHIQDPVQGIFHPQGPRPVPTDGGPQRLRLRRAAGDEGADCRGHLRILAAAGRHCDQALQIPPGPRRVHVRQDVGDPDHEARPGFDAARAAVHGVVQVPARRVGALGRRGMSQGTGVLHRVLQVPLVPCERQDLVGLLRPQGPGHLCLGAPPSAWVPGLGSRYSPARPAVRAGAGWP